jgi:predicted aldo/keto reductase-like oxidoreductase
MEFGQLQINYVDWTFQQAQEKLELLKKWNIPVIVMEPVRGGKLASIAPNLEAKLSALRPDERVPGWAFRFLQSVDGVFTTLSGMSNFEQLKENIKTYEEAKPLNQTEWDTLQDVAQEMLGRMTPCTSCKYCIEYCPQGLNIPDLLRLYNEHAFTGGGFIAPMKLNSLPEDKRPSACLQCRACEAVCPQNIRISEVFEDFTKRLK